MIWEGWIFYATVKFCNIKIKNSILYQTAETFRFKSQLFWSALKTKEKKKLHLFQHWIFSDFPTGLIEITPRFLLFKQFVIVFDNFLFWNQRWLVHYWISSLQSGVNFCFVEESEVNKFFFLFILLSFCFVATFICKILNVLLRRFYCINKIFVEIKTLLILQTDVSAKLFI